MNAKSIVTRADGTAALGAITRNGITRGSIVGLAAAAMLMAGCSDDNPATSDQATVRMEAGMTGAVAAKAGKMVVGMAGEEADSLRISRIRILVSRLKLHRDKEDSTAGDRDVKVGPFMLEIAPGAARLVTTAAIPPGTYDKVKLEFHRFSSSEIGTYLNDTTFGAFVTNDRYSFIIDGTVWSGGTGNAFTYRSDATANLSLKLDKLAQMNAGDGATLLLQLDPTIAFGDGGAILDPRDPRNENKIDDAIVRAIKALKK